MSDRKARAKHRGVIVWTALAVAISACAAVLPYLELRGVAAIPVAQAVLPLGAVVLLILALASALFRTWIAALVLFIGAVVSGVPALTPIHGGPACPAGAEFTVLSFNAKLAGADPAMLADLIRTTDPSVVMLLETDEALIDAVLHGHDLAGALPHRTREVSTGGASGSAILSAYPLSQEETIPGSEFDQVSAVATLADGQTVRVAAVHPPPPVWQPNGWRSGIDDIAEWVHRTPDERLVIAGDLNASFAHPALRRLATGLRSAAEAAGPLPWPTWPEAKPVPAFTAIDHVFARGAIPLGWDSFHVDGSDHRAVLATWDLCAADGATAQRTTDEPS